MFLGYVGERFLHLVDQKERPRLQFIDQLYAFDVDGELRM